MIHLNPREIRPQYDEREAADKAMMNDIIVELHQITTPGEYWYMATPYTKYADGRDRAFMDACALVVAFTSVGVPVYSPIAHWHIPDTLGQFGDDEQMWQRINAPLLTNAKGLLVCKLPGWEFSRGVAAEIAACESTKPIYYVNLPPLAQVAPPVDQPHYYA